MTFGCMLLLCSNLLHLAFPFLHLPYVGDMRILNILIISYHECLYYLKVSGVQDYDLLRLIQSPKTIKDRLVEIEFVSRMYHFVSISSTRCEYI